MLGLRTLASTVLAHRESRHVVKYGLVGVSNTVIDFAVYALLLSLGLWYVAAKVLSVVVAVINGYTWNRRWTFRTGAHRNETLARYVAVHVTALTANLAVLTGLVELVGLSALTGQLVAIPFVAAFSFTANRLWTFGRYIPPGPPSAAPVETPVA